MKSPESKQDKIGLPDILYRLNSRLRFGSINEEGKITEGNDVGTLMATMHFEDLLKAVNLGNVIEELRKTSAGDESLYRKLLIKKLLSVDSLEIENTFPQKLAPLPPDLEDSKPRFTKEEIGKAVDMVNYETSSDALKAWVHKIAKKNPRLSAENNEENT